MRNKRQGGRGYHSRPAFIAHTTKEQKTKIMETLFKSFENIKMFHAYLERGETQPAFKDFVSSQDETKRKERDAKTKTYDEADNLLLYGDKKTAKAIEQNGVADVRANISREMQRRQVFSSVVGFAPNVPAYLAGAPNSMINQRITTQRKRFSRWRIVAPCLAMCRARIF